MKSSVAVVGVGGYGNYCLELLEKEVDPSRFELTGIIDPYAEKAPRYEMLQSKGIPFYPTLDAFYEKHQADLVLINSPVGNHKENCMDALSHGSNVLCEKPLVPLMEDALDLQRAVDSAKKVLGVGFQWSWSSTMLEVKRDILAGLYGKPRLLKTYISWPRSDAYYTGWKGKLKDTAGQFILDSIASNATAHYLHNLFFITGDQMHTSRFPKSITGSVYRAREIETFDTCFLTGDLGEGCEFLYIATHVGEVEVQPRFLYTFEEGTIEFSPQVSPSVKGYLKDGTVKEYGCVQSQAENAQKFIQMLNVIQNNEIPTCTVSTILPHLQVCNALIEQFPVQDMPASLCIRRSTPPELYVKGLCEAAQTCYEQNILPDSLGLDWAANNVHVSFK